MRKRALRTYLIFTLLVMVLVFIIGCKDSRSKKSFVQTSLIQVDSLSQIELISDSLVAPRLYSHLPGLDKLPSDQSKAVFISALLPSILVAKHNIQHTRTRVEELAIKDSWESSDSVFFAETKVRYKATDLEDLRNRIIYLPNSLVLAQAAVESAWGQSRFFLQANNVFGIWSYNENEPRMKAGLIRRNTAVQVYVKTYPNFEESIENYFIILGSANAYKSLRKASLKTQDPFLLLPHLKYYSEQRTAYTNLLKSVILHNDLTQYDHYQIDPIYIVSQ